MFLHQYQRQVHLIQQTHNMRSLIPIFLVAVSLGLYYTYINPQYAAIQELKSQSNQYQLALDKAKELEQERDVLLTKYNNFSQEDINRINRILPNKVNTVKLITDIDSVAARYGITIRSVSVTQTNLDNAQAVVTEGVPEKLYNTTTIAFKFSSTYPNLVQFLKDLEKSVQMIDMQFVRFEVGETDDSSGVHSYEVSFNTYWLK